MIIDLQDAICHPDLLTLQPPETHSTQHTHICVLIQLRLQIDKSTRSNLYNNLCRMIAKSKRKLKAAEQWMGTLSFTRDKVIHGNVS